MHNQSNADISLEIVLFLMNSTIVHGFLANFLIVIVFPSVEIGNKVALTIFEAFKNEVDFYREFSKFFGYEFFIMRKIG